MPKPKKRAAPIIVKTHKAQINKSVAKTAGPPKPGKSKGKQHKNLQRTVYDEDNRASSGKAASTSSRQNTVSTARPAGGGREGRPRKSNFPGVVQKQLRCMSTVDQQAAAIVGRLLEADASRKHGASLKSLVFASHIEAKKATYAVCCEVLRAFPVLGHIWQQLSGYEALVAKVGGAVLRQKLTGHTRLTGVNQLNLTFTW